MRNIVGRPVQGDDFFIQQKLMNKLARLFNNGENILIHGHAKSGKTSLLLHIHKQYSNTVYLDLSPIQTIFDFYYALFNELNIAYSATQSVATLHSTLISELVKISTKRLKILLDNCEPEHCCLSVIQELSKKLELSYVQFVVTTTPNMMSSVAQFDPLLDSFISLPLAGLTDSDTSAFLNNLILQFDPEFIDYTPHPHGLTPHILQLIAQRLHDLVIERELILIKKHRLKQVFDSLANEPRLFIEWPTALEESFKKADYDFAKALIDSLANHQELNLDDIIHLARQAKIGNSYKGIVKALQTYGYLEEFEKERYRFKSELIKAWWCEHVLDDINLRPSKEFKPIQINALTLKQIKCIAQAEINFNAPQNTTLLLGTNARGKTTILQLIALGLANIHHVPFVQSWEKVVKEGAEFGEFELDVTIDNQPMKFNFKINANDSIDCTNNADKLEQLQNKFLVLAYGANRHIKLEDPRPNKPIEAIATLFGENGYLKHIKVSSNFEYVSKNFAAIAPMINQVLKMADTVNQVELVDFDTQSLYFKTPSSERIPLSALSEGFKSTFVWLFDMIIRIVEKGGDLDNAKSLTGIVLLDEVDLHLHPSWQRTIVPSLNTLFPNIQLIITSHSPFVAQSIHSDHIISLNWENDKLEVINKDYQTEMSYGEVAREIFEISSPFSQATEEKLQQFKALTVAIRKEQDYDEEEFKALVVEIARKGPELEGIMRRYMQDLERRTGLEFGLWKK